MRPLQIARIAPLVLVAACFGEKVPTEQVGGTQYGMLLSVPSPVRLPTATFTTRSRVVGTATVVDSLNLVVSNLKPLTGPARYQFYLVNGRDSVARAVRATVRLVRTDSVVGAAGVTTTTSTSSLGTVAFLAGMPNNTIANVTIGAPLDTVGSASSFVVMTIQADSARPTWDANTPKPLWLTFRNPTTNALVATGTSLFGGFSEGGRARLYAAQGSGRSVFWDINRDARLTFSGIAIGMTQAPRGYYYQPWVRDTRTGRAARFGLLRDSLGNSLFDRDTAAAIGTVAQLPNARFGATEDSIGGRFTEFGLVQLVLEPKLGDMSFPGVSAVLQGQLPDTLAVRRPAGVVDVTVRRGTAPLAGATVVVLAAGSNVILASRATDAEGRATLDALPSGRVDVRVFAPGATTAGASQAGALVTAGQTLALTLTVP